MFNQVEFMEMRSEGVGLLSDGELADLDRRGVDVDEVVHQQSLRDALSILVDHQEQGTGPEDEILDAARDLSWGCRLDDSVRLLLRIGELQIIRRRQQLAEVAREAAKLARDTVGNAMAGVAPSGGMPA